MKIIFSRAIFKDIRFWLIVYFLIRLFHITQPPLEIAHNWRQSTGLMVSRNFYEIDANILYPRVDMAGEKTGITGTEFPFFNYLIYLFAKVFGWADWYGRLINLMVSTLGVYWFYRLIKKALSPETAFFASFILLNSLWFAYSRKTMPDTFSVSLVFGGLFYGISYLEKGSFWQLIGSFLLVLAGLLSKIPAGIFMPVLVFPFLDKKLPLSRKAWLFVLLGIALVPVGWWYFYWVPYLVKKYEFWHYYMGTSLADGAHEIITHLDQAIQKFYFCALNYIGFGLCLAGLALAIIRKQKLLLRIAGLCFAAEFVFILKAGFAFYHHNYYIMPFVPVMAMLAGYAVSCAEKPLWQFTLCLAVATEVIINALPEFRINADQRYKLTLESLAARHASPHDLIAINCGPNPQQIYLAHRKGWNLENENEMKPAYITAITKLGCKILIINKHESLQANYNFPVIEENADFRVYRLSGTSISE